MVTAEESRMYQQFAAPNPLNLHPMAALLQQEQNCSLPHFTPALKSLAAIPGQPNPDFHGLNPEQQNAIGGVHKPQPPCPTQGPCSIYSRHIMPHRLGIPDVPVDASHKRFLIFDQSQNHTRLFLSPSVSPQNQIAASKTPQLDLPFSLKPVVEENWGENSLTDEEDEMLEDSEEIDALFYSDTHDEDSDTDGDNDEVTSMAHVPFSNEDTYSNEKSLEELAEEVARSNGMQKRQKLLDGRCKILPPLLNAKCPVERASSCTYEDDVESSCAGGKISYDDINSRKRERTVKVRDALKMMEAIIPGLSSNSNEPLQIIEKAIVFLKSMRIEAEALGLGYLDHQSAAFP